MHPKLQLVHRWVPVKRVRQERSAATSLRLAARLPIA